MKNVQICECCGAKIVSYKYRFNEGLLNCLVALSRNNGKTIAQMGLSNSEYASFHKLKYFSLAERQGEKNFITLKGIYFLRGDLRIPEYVIIRKGEFVEAAEKNIFWWEALKEIDRRQYYVDQIKEGLKDEM